MDIARFTSLKVVTNPRTVPAKEIFKLLFTITLVIGLALGTLPVSPANAATITVSSCDAADLIAAFNTAESNGEDDTIILQSGCTYSLTSPTAADPDGYGPAGLPAITTNITVEGNGVAITRSGTDPFRFFYISDSGNLALQDLTLSNGLARGGNGGDAQYDGAGAGAGLGGAIFNRGTLSLDTVTLTGNTAQGGNGGTDTSGAPSAAGGGGGMGGNGQNGPGSNSGGDGGGINGGAGGSSASTTVRNGVSGGIGGGGGGAAYKSGYGIPGNGGFGGGGGGGGNTSAGGHGGFGGGGGGNQSGTDHSPGGFGGGDGGKWAGGGGAGMGGAIFNDGGALTIVDSSLTSNTAQGGNGGTSSGGTHGNGGSGFGGAIFSYNGPVTTTNVTFTGNSVIAGTGRVAGNTVKPDIYNAYITVTKTAAPTSAMVNQTITYTYQIENGGNVILNAISATDTPLGSVTLASTTLNPGETTTGALTYQVVLADFPGPLSNQVDVAGTTPDGLQVINTDNVSVPLLNSPPDAQDDTASTDEDTIATETAPGVLVNDTDADLDSLEVTEFDTTSVNGAIVNVNTDGSYSYDPTGATALQALAQGDNLADTFTYTVDDGNNNADTATVTVTVGGVNDAPTISDQTFGLDENSDPGDPVGTVAADDVDTGDSLTFGITGGNPGDVFAIAPASGQITVNDSSQLDFETTPSFALTVVVTDTDGLTDSATITVDLNDLNDAPTIANQSFAIDENSPNSTVVGTVLADDVDAGDSLTFGITDGDPADAFAIAPANGQITVNDSSQLDFETTPSFALIVVVTDTGGLTDSATVTININNVGYAPTLQLDKSGPATASVGATIQYTFTVSHATTSDKSSVSSVSVTDDVAGPATLVSGDSNGNNRLDGSEIWLFTVNYTIQPTDGDPLQNTATVSGQDLDGNDIPPATDSHTLDLIFSPAVAITANWPNEAAIGDTIVYTFTINHAASSDGSPLQSVLVSDTLVGPMSLNSGDDGNNLLEQGENWRFGGTYTISEGDPDPLSNQVTVTCEDQNANVVTKEAEYSLDVVPQSGPGRIVYLPLIIRGGGPSGPDLVVKRVLAANGLVQVVIHNQGNRPVQAADEFWVDLYVDPAPVPTGVNQVATDGRSEQYIVWGVTAPALPLNPTESFTLTYSTAPDAPNYYNFADLTNFSGSVPAGVPIYVQVDSANDETEYGSVLEDHEMSGGAYNNITGPIVFSATDLQQIFVGTATDREAPPVSAGNLPPR